MSLVFILFSVFNQNYSHMDNRPKLIYIGDPMCSWCYGISDELSKLVDHYEDQVDLQIIMGGLRPGGGEEWNENFKNFLKSHWTEINHRTGKKFSFDLFEKEQFHYDTEPACRSVVTALEMDKKIGLKFFELVQEGFYLENKDPKQTNFYSPICEKLGLDFNVFTKLFESQALKDKTQENFQQSAQLGVNSFPTILFQQNDKTYILSRGYQTFETMKERLDGLKK